MRLRREFLPTWLEWQMKLGSQVRAFGSVGRRIRSRWYCDAAGVQVVYVNEGADELGGARPVMILEIFGSR